jgi:hypothetical protein
MEIGFDLLAELKGRLASGRDIAESHGPDWPGLHARLSAAHAARRVLASVARPAGSFATASSGLFQGVNLTDSTDGKSPAGIEAPVARDNMTGDRGQ